MALRKGEDADINERHCDFIKDFVGKADVKISVSYGEEL